MSRKYESARSTSSHLVETVAVVVLTIAFVLFGTIALMHWWDTVPHHGDGGGSGGGGDGHGHDHDESRVFSLFEIDTLACNGGDCSVLGVTQALTGDICTDKNNCGSTLVGNTTGQCITANDNVPNVYYMQVCVQVYNFFGTNSNFPKGSIMATGEFMGTNSLTAFYRTETWAVTGGSGAYFDAQGTLSFTTAQGEAFYTNTFTIST